MLAMTLHAESPTFAEPICGVPVESGGSAAATAMVLCCEADRLGGVERQSVLMRGLKLAEEAAAADPSDAQAHFAVFCNLGKQIQSRPLHPTDVAVIGRLQREIDTVLALTPDDADALAAKGAMLLALPWFLGGNARQGEELLRAALIKDPSNAAAVRYLAAAQKTRNPRSGRSEPRR